jgi:hypothetical protein
VGIDDFGTATKELCGWTIACLAEDRIEAFVNTVNGLLPRGMDQFHGKGFSRRVAGEYGEFLRQLKHTCEAVSGSFIACTLNNPVWKDDFTSFANRIMEQTFTKIGISLSAEQTAALRQIVSPLFTFLRMSSRMGAEHEVVIFIADDQVTKGFGEMSVSVAGSSVPLSHLAVELCNAYRTQVFPDAPRVATNGVRIVHAADAPIVQAADVVGNFSTAFLFRHLGKQSKTNNLKAEIFHSTFSDCGIDGIPHEQMLEADGDDLRLKGDGAYTLRMG